MRNIMVKLFLCLALTIGSSSGYCESVESDATEFSTAHVKTELLITKARVMASTSAFLFGSASATLASKGSLLAGIGVVPLLALVLLDELDALRTDNLESCYSRLKSATWFSSLFAGTALLCTPVTFSPILGTVLLVLPFSASMTSYVTGRSVADALVEDVIRRLGLAVIPQEAAI